MASFFLVFFPAPPLPYTTAKYRDGGTSIELQPRSRVQSVRSMLLSLLAAATGYLAQHVAAGRANRAGRVVALDVGTAIHLSEAQRAAQIALAEATDMYVGDTIADFGIPAQVRTYINEAPKLDSSVLGIEASRAAIAQSESGGVSSKKGEVSWCSGVAVADGEFHLSTLTTWNNPTVFVPHFHSAVGIVDGHLALCIDFRPRADAGYETVLPDGTYPEPTSREMFALGSTRKELAELFFTDDAVAWAQSLRALDGAKPPPVPSVPYECAGPLLVDLRLPLTDANVAAVSSACAEAAALYVSWMQGAEKQGQVRTMQIFAKDAKVRAQTLAYSTMVYETQLGAIGSDIAAADAGPMDISNRGAAQNNAAQSAFGDDDEKDLSATDMMDLQSQGGSVYDEGGQNY